jgi:hypothetical protein
MSFDVVFGDLKPGDRSGFMGDTVKIRGDSILISGDCTALLEAIAEIGPSDKDLVIIAWQQLVVVGKKEHSTFSFGDPETTAYFGCIKTLMEKSLGIIEREGVELSAFAIISHELLNVGKVLTLAVAHRRVVRIRQMRFDPADFYETHCLYISLSERCVRATIDNMTTIPEDNIFQSYLLSYYANQRVRDEDGRFVRDYKSLGLDFYKELLFCGRFIPSLSFDKLMVLGETLAGKLLPDGEDIPIWHEIKDISTAQMGSLMSPQLVRLADVFASGKMKSDALFSCIASRVDTGALSLADLSSLARSFSYLSIFDQGLLFKVAEEFTKSKCHINTRQDLNSYSRVLWSISVLSASADSVGVLAARCKTVAEKIFLEAEIFIVSEENKAAYGRAMARGRATFRGRAMAAGRGRRRSGAMAAGRGRRRSGPMAAGRGRGTSGPMAAGRGRAVPRVMPLIVDSAVRERFLQGAMLFKLDLSTKYSRLDRAFKSTTRRMNYKISGSQKLFFLAISRALQGLLGRSHTVDLEHPDEILSIDITIEPILGKGIIATPPSIPATKGTVAATAAPVVDEKVEPFLTVVKHRHGGRMVTLPELGRTAIEYDGPFHYGVNISTEESFYLGANILKNCMMKQRGWRVVRFAYNVVDLSRHKDERYILGLLRESLTPSVA